MPLTKEEQNQLDANINAALKRAGASPAGDTSGKPASAEAVARAAQNPPQTPADLRPELPEALRDGGAKK
jgi:hypothetical protein